MYVLASGIKADPVRRWNLPDRIFFGHGACHILAGVYLARRINPEFKPYWIKPKQYPGNHIFLSDGQVAFDHRGYSLLSRLKAHHWKIWNHQYEGWEADICSVEFDLLDEESLNARSMRGPKQYHGDPIARAKAFLELKDHQKALERTRSMASAHES